MQEPSERAVAKRRSQLVPAGAVLIGLSLLVPQPLDQAAKQMAPGLGRAVAFIATDVFRAFFFAGIACLLIGWLRNRKLKGKAERNRVD
jgi:hypothetical protein